MSEDWFESEKNAYEVTFSGARDGYMYYALNEYYGNFEKKYEKKINVLGYGAAEGGELEHIAQYCNKICIVDPTKKMQRNEIKGISVAYYHPNVEGRLPFADEQFDLITCFGVLMYIMNPETVVSELIRVLRKGGVLLIREPNTDMHVHQGIERWGMGEDSRGLPPSFFDKNVRDGGVSLYSINYCMFSPWYVVGHKLMKRPFNHKWYVRIDAILSKLFEWNWKYSRKTFWDKFSPGSVFIRAVK